MSDRGSDPIITEDSFNTEMPLNINDEDLKPGTEVEVRSQDCFTDTTFSLVILEAFKTERRLNTVSVNSAFPGKDQAAEVWAQRRAWVIECQRRMEDKYLRYCNSEITIQRFTMQVADIMNARLWLWAYRPLQRQPNDPITATVPYPGTLHFSVEVLEKTAQIPLDAAFQPYLWISNIWVQWHALAVMVAELCVQTQGPTVARAWAIANVMFEETARHVADSAKGRLWSPIKKLMNKAQAIRKQHLEDVALAQGLVPVGLGTQHVQPASQHQHGGGRFDNTMEWSIEAPQQQHGWTDLGQTQRPHGMPQNSINVEPLGVGWDTWLNGTTVEMNPGSELNQIGWNDWESFVNDFQASGEFLPRPDPL